MSLFKNKEHSKSNSSKSKSKRGYQNGLGITPQSVADLSTNDAAQLYCPSSNSNASSSSSSNDHKKNNSKNSKGKNGMGKLLGKLFSKNGKSRSSINGDIASLEQISNRQISEKMAEEEYEMKSTLYILLLGAGGSGKTTVFKQMQKLFHGFIDEKEMEFALDDIRENIMVDMIDLCKYNMEYGKKIESSQLQEVCSRISTLNSIDQPNTLLSKSLSKEIDLLWNHPSIKETWEKRKKSHIMDNTPYFLNKVKEIACDGYCVTFDDYVRLRDQTTGIIHKKFLVKTQHGNYKFNVTDVGGQRSERRKWIKLFDNVNVVVYIMNLAGYDQVLYEDNTKNCLNETLELFQSTCHSKAFTTTDWVVFFNKIDIFELKIKQIPFTKFKKDFNKNYATNSDKVQEHIRNEFKQRFYQNKNGQIINKRGEIYFHTTCATDALQVGEIIKKVQIDIISSAMKKMGYLF